MKNIFIAFGKIFLLILTFILAGGAYYWGRQSVQTARAIAIKPTDSPTPKLFPTISSIATESGEMILAKKTINAGALLQQLYSIDVLPGWIEKNKHTDDNTDSLILSKNDYVLTIYQSNSGGGMCSFPDEKIEDAPLLNEYPEGSFTDLIGTSGELYRRVELAPDAEDQKKSFLLCDKRHDTYQEPTRYGHISYETPADPEETLLKNMDMMVTSLKKK